jgi:hypothetical protein
MPVKGPYQKLGFVDTECSNRKLARSAARSMLKSPIGSGSWLYHSVKSVRFSVAASPVTYRSSRVFEESASIKLCDPAKPLGVPVTRFSQFSMFAGYWHQPKSPRRFPSRFVVAVVCPPIEKLGFKEMAFPLHTVPIVDRMVLRSNAMPKTAKMLDSRCLFTMARRTFVDCERSF